MQNEYIKKLESAYKRRALSKSVERHNVACEACGTNILRYLGPEHGILCAECASTNTPWALPPKWVPQGDLLASLPLSPKFTKKFH